MSITFPCPKCQSSITPDMNACTHCGTELVPIAIKSRPIASPDSYGYHDNYRPQYHSQQSYKEKPKANKLVIIFLALFLGLFSAIGYRMIVKADTINRKIFGVFLILFSIACNIMFFVTYWHLVWQPIYKRITVNSDDNGEGNYNILPSIQLSLFRPILFYWVNIL